MAIGLRLGVQGPYTKKGCIMNDDAFYDVL